LLAEIRELGYRGGYTAVKDYLRRQRPKLPLAFEQRFEVEPGSQAQVDFATFKTPFGTVYALLVVLSWSRFLWVRFSFHQDQLTVLGGLHQAFVAFGGVPRTLLFDRMRTAVAGSEVEGRAVFNAELLRFAAHYGFVPQACRPYRAKTKGRVERAISYLRQGFFYGRTFRDLADLNSQGAAWLKTVANTRVHGTTREVPDERLERERSHLRLLPDTPYIPMLTMGRRVSRDGFITYNGNSYSVPDGLMRAEVWVRATLTDLWLLQDGQVVAVHSLLEGRGELSLDPSHRRSKVPLAGTGQHDGPQSIWDAVEVQRRPLDVYERVLR
jgi:transposase